MNINGQNLIEDGRSLLGESQKEKWVPSESKPRTYDGLGLIGFMDNLFYGIRLTCTTPHISCFK